MNPSSRSNLSASANKRYLFSGEESLNREDDARLKLPNLWRTIDIMSEGKKQLALVEKERERDREGGGRKSTTQAIGCPSGGSLYAAPAGRDATELQRPSFPHPNRPG